MTATLDAPPGTGTTITLTIARQALRTALSKLATVVGTGTRTLPLAQHVKFDVTPGALTLTAADGDFASFVRLTVPCDASDTGVALLPAKRLAEIVANLPPVGAVTLKLGNQRATITAGRARFELGGLHPDDFPVTPAVEAAERLTVDAAAFLGAMERVVPHASTADARQNLNVVRLAASSEGPTHGLRLAAFEGHHMAWLSVDCSGGQFTKPCSLHRTSVPILARLFSGSPAKATLTLGVDGNRLVLEGSDASATVRLVHLDFPDYAPAIAGLVPRRTVVCDRLLLAGAIRRVALVAGETQRVAVTLGDEITIAAADATLGAGDDVVTIDEHRRDPDRGDPEREARTFDLNASGALTCLDTLPDAQVAITLDTADKPVLIRPADVVPVEDPNWDRTLVLIQPLRRI